MKEAYYLLKKTRKPNTHDYIVIEKRKKANTYAYQI